MRFVSAFDDELEKLAAPTQEELQEAYDRVRREERNGGSSLADAIRGKGKPVSRDYLSSALIGAAAAPAISLLSSVVSRRLRNRGLAKMLGSARTKVQRRAIKDQMVTGPVFGKTKPGDKWNTAPLMTPEDAIGKAVGGAAAGSAVQMVRDRYSGSGKA